MHYALEQVRRGPHVARTLDPAPLIARPVARPAAVATPIEANRRPGSRGARWRSPVTIGAMKLALDALDRELQLLTALGKLPQNLSLVRAEAEMNQIEGNG